MQSTGVLCVHRLVTCLKTVMLVTLLLFRVVDWYCQAHPRSVCQSDEYLLVEKGVRCCPVLASVLGMWRGLLLHLAKQSSESCQLSMILCLELTVVDPDEDSDGCCD